MKRYLLDTGIAACYIDRRRGVFERAQTEVGLGNWIGIAHPVLGELAYRVEGSPRAQPATASLSSLLLEAWPLTPPPSSCSVVGVPALLPRYRRNTEGSEGTEDAA